MKTLVREEPRRRTVILHARVIGRIWWPVGQVCHRDITTAVRDDETLRDAMLRLTADGDLQCGYLAPEDTWITVTDWSRSTRRTRSWMLRFSCPETADLMAPQDMVDDAYTGDSDDE